MTAALEKSAAEKAPSVEPSAELEQVRVRFGVDTRSGSTADVALFADTTQVVQRLRALEARLDAAEPSKPAVRQAVATAQPAGAKQK